MAEFKSPFSARNRGPHQQIDNSFPESARIAVLHLICDLEEKSYIPDWPTIARELQRIARHQPISYDSSFSQEVERARIDAEEALFSLKWDKVYDFCERLYGYLSKDVKGWIESSKFGVVVSKSEVQTYISNELERLFLEEQFSFEFIDGVVRRRGRNHTEEQATRAQVVLGDLRLTESRNHYIKALNFFRDPLKPDYENCVKEAVCAVEAAGKKLFPAAKASTLGDLIKWFKITKEYEIPKALLNTIEGIYAYRNGGNGVGHGGAEGGVATVEVAEYVLGVTASQIIYLVGIEKIEDEIPF